MKYGFQFNKKILEESLAFGGKKPRPCSEKMVINQDQEDV